MSFRIKNFSMQTFNYDVNNSGDPGDKYKTWSAYKTGVANFISDAIAQHPQASSIIVFGAGECNDLDLHRLAGSFRRIVLTDIDERSIYDGIARQRLGKHEAQNIQVVQAEYTGLDSARFFDTFSTLVSDNAPIAQISSFIKNALKNVMSPNMSKTLGKFDIVLSCPIYTQIVYTQAQVLLQILEQYSTYSPPDIAALTKTMADSMPYLITKYNDLLRSAAAPDGLLVMLTDIIETHPRDDLLPKISVLLSALPVDTDALERLVCAHGLEFGKLGRDDLQTKAIVRSSRWLLWPFDAHRHYLVNGIIAAKK